MLPPSITKLFVLVQSAPPLPKGTIGAASQPPSTQSTGVFISPQSLISFPVAALVVKVAWELAKALGLAWTQTKWFAFWGALAVGFIVFLINLDGSNPKPVGWRQWCIAIAIFLINSLFLCATVLGIPVSVATPADGK